MCGLAAGHGLGFLVCASVEGSTLLKGLCASQGRKVLNDPARLRGALRFRAEGPARYMDRGEARGRTGMSPKGLLSDLSQIAGVKGLESPTSFAITGRAFSPRDLPCRFPVSRGPRYHRAGAFSAPTHRRADSMSRTAMGQSISRKKRYRNLPSWTETMI